jgi:hypothetical protein
VQRNIDDDDDDNDKYELQGIDSFDPTDRDLILVEVVKTISGTYFVVQPKPAGQLRLAAAIESAHLTKIQFAHLDTWDGRDIITDNPAGVRPDSPFKLT